MFKNWICDKQNVKHCSEGGTLVMLAEVGHESEGVLTKSQLSKYQRGTYFDLVILAIDILDDINHRNYAVTNLFHQLGVIFSLWKLVCSELFCSHYFELCDRLIFEIFGISGDLLQWKRGKWCSLCFWSAGYLNRDSSVLWVSCHSNWPQDTSSCCLVNGLE